MDETYIEFAPAGSTCLPLLEKYDNLVITHTFSKTHNLAGARLGFCLARPELIADMNRSSSATALQRQLPDPGGGHGRHPG